MIQFRLRAPLTVLSVIIVAVLGSGMSASKYSDGKDIEVLFHMQMKDLISEVNILGKSVQARQSLPSLKDQFRRSRSAYKRASILLDYFFPYQRKFINGPDIRKAEEETPDVVVNPKGFQVIERILCTGFADSSYSTLHNEISDLKELLTEIEAQRESAHKFKNELVFDALRSADIRLMSQGITGFDSPILLNSISEAASTLEGIHEIILVFKNDIQSYQFDSCHQLINGGIKILSSKNNFNSFDRLNFIKNYADPLYTQIVAIAAKENYILAEERRPLNQFSKSIFSKDAFDINYFSPNSRYQVTDKRKYLGALLFSDTIFSLTAKRSCASCHHPENAFADGLKSPFDLTGGNKLKRNTPTLLNAGLQTRFFYDSRTETLENQLNSVVHNIDEMNGSLKSSIPLLRADKKYNALFIAAYPAEAIPVTEYNIANAISSYVRSLVIMNSTFDRYMRGENVKLSKSATIGFNLFAGKAKCGTCHYLPLFNGLIPPQFSETESEVIGVPGGPGKRPRIDEDLGKFLFTRSQTDRYAFKTPTLRNVDLTAPYMHNGVFKNLEEVLDFYNKGGGAGLHIAPENETLPNDKLHLSKREMRDIISFLHTLNSSNQ
ncbi:MAG: cytochrome c peroxidase [Flavitalea sp.]